MNLLRVRLAFLVITVALVCFALSPQAQAVDPPPDGGYANGNTAEGTDALFSLTTGIENTAMGFHALFTNTTGNNNTANGFEALLLNTTGTDNTATGALALFNNTTGTHNTANGNGALFDNTIGNENTANGDGALLNNTSGNENTANGVSVLLNNTSGNDNTANGFIALISNTTGSENTATGVSALHNNTTGNDNTADGGNALFSNTTGGSNTASGVGALNFNTTGFFNTAIGDGALFNNTTGSNNIALGLSAGINLTTGNNNIDIGNAGVAGESKRIRIGQQGTQNGTFIAGIRGVTTQNANAIPVLIDSAGQLGTMSSSRRFKKEIKAMNQTSEAILGLRPVTFHYKGDSEGTAQFGLIAEEVAEVNPNLVIRDKDGETYTVRYDAVNAMLLNEFLKEHRKNEKQRKDFEAALAQQQKQIDALTATVQKVSAQLEVSKSAPQIVANNQ